MAKYHHGNLRNTLLAIAIEMLAKNGVQSLSLRKIAQQVGVSHNAPYMHFADKEALLVAIAEEGFRQLSTEVDSAISQTDHSIRQQLIAASQAYVNFALNHPNHSHVMFRPFDATKYPDLLKVSQASLNQLFALVKSGQERGELSTAANTHEMTKAIWAMVHGVSAISIASQTTVLLPEKASVEDVVSTFITFLIDGLSA